MFKTTAALCTVALAAGSLAHADFSYTATQKNTGGAMSAMAGTAADRTSKYYWKGQKMAIDSGTTSTIIDFGAQTVTSVNNTLKTYTVKPFSEVGAGTGTATDVTIDVKDTEQTKEINGFKASETVINMSMDMDTGRGPAMKALVEMDLWISPDVPGASELRAFYRKNAANFPWSAMTGGGGNPGMQKAMAQLQKKMSEMNGVPVEEVIRVKSAGGAQAGGAQAGGTQVVQTQMPQMTAAQQAQMQAAMAKMQAMANQGGPQAAAAQQAMASMGGMARGGGGAASAASGSLIEMTVDASGFSNSGVPDSVFAIPAGYKAGQ